MSFWSGASAAPAAEPVKPRWQPMRISARAICCPVGHTAAAATAAINARMNHFRETDFVAPGGVPLNGSALFDFPVWGAERLGHMLRTVLDEIVAARAPIGPAEIEVVVMIAESDRPGLDSTLVAGTLLRALDPAPDGWGDLRTRVHLAPYGKGGIGRALQLCATLLDGAQAPPYVLLCAVDSLLNAGAIEHFLSQERLLMDVNADGFIPGEAAAAILLSRQPAASAAVWIDAAATAHDPWRIDGRAPMRAAGLTQAIRSAADTADTKLIGLDFHASGMAGEAWYVKEAGLALSRCIEQRKPSFPHLIVARSVGETGAASSVLTLAWLAGTMTRAEGGPGRAGLLHFSGDDGERSALVVRARP